MLGRCHQKLSPILVAIGIGDSGGRIPEMWPRSLHGRDRRHQLDPSADDSGAGCIEVQVTPGRRYLIGKTEFVKATRFGPRQVAGFKELLAALDVGGEPRSSVGQLAGRDSFGDRAISAAASIRPQLPVYGGSSTTGSIRALRRTYQQRVLWVSRQISSPKCLLLAIAWLCLRSFQSLSDDGRHSLRHS